MDKMPIDNSAIFLHQHEQLKQEFVCNLMDSIMEDPALGLALNELALKGSRIGDDDGGRTALADFMATLMANPGIWEFFCRSWMITWIDSTRKIREIQDMEDEDG